VGAGHRRCLCKVHKREVLMYECNCLVICIAIDDHFSFIESGDHFQKFFFSFVGGHQRCLCKFHKWEVLLHGEQSCLVVACIAVEDHSSERLVQCLVFDDPAAHSLTWRLVCDVLSS
jgi:hypothetical protein